MMQVICVRRGWGGIVFGGDNISVQFFTEPVPVRLVAWKCAPFGGHGGNYYGHPNLRYLQELLRSGAHACEHLMSRDIDKL